jgi:ribonucleotide monophosphatase NagD (HAD superfamily)
VRIVLAIYRLHKNAIPYYLLANYTRKNILHENISDGFARIDGQPVESKARPVCLSHDVTLDMLSC